MELSGILQAVESSDAAELEAAQQGYPSGQGECRDSSLSEGAQILQSHVLLHQWRPDSFQTLEQQRAGIDFLGYLSRSPFTWNQRHFVVTPPSVSSPTNSCNMMGMEECWVAEPWRWRTDLGTEMRIVRGEVVQGPSVCGSQISSLFFFPPLK